MVITPPPGLSRNVPPPTNTAQNGHEKSQELEFQIQILTAEKTSLQEDNDQKKQTIDILRYELELLKNVPANEIRDLKVKFKELKELEKKEKDDLRYELGIY